MAITKITVSVDEKILKDFDKKIKESGLERSKIIEGLMEAYINLNPDEYLNKKKEFEDKFLKK